MPINPDTKLSFNISRRRFMFVAPFIPGALAQVACSPSNREGEATSEDQKLFDSFTTNAQLTDELKRRFGIVSGTTRQTYAQKVIQLASDKPKWMQGVRITYTNTRNERVGYTVADSGEGKPFTGIKYKVSYPTPNPIVSELIPVGQDRYCAVYGNLDTVSRFKARKNEFAPFIQEYFQDTPTPAALHVLFLPFANNFNLISPVDGITITAKDTQGRSAVAVKDGRVTQTHVMLHIPLIHAVSLNYGISAENELRGTLVNEGTDTIITQNLLPKNPNFKVPESIGTIATTLAELDDDFAQLVIGGKGYKNFTSVVVDEIARIGIVKEAA